MRFWRKSTPLCKPNVVMTLPPRLQAIANLIPPGSRVADVGTDHGLLPLYLLSEKRAAFVVATDIALGPLQAAKENTRRLGVTKGLDFRLADGLNAVSPDEVDVIVIAGMGGETMCNILSTAPWITDAPYRILLQPQSKLPELLDFLAHAGYEVWDQHLAAETGRIFTILEVYTEKMRPAGAQPPPKGGFRYVCPQILKRGDALLGAYLDGLIRKLSRTLEGMGNAVAPSSKQDALQQTLSDIEKWRRTQ